MKKKYVKHLAAIIKDGRAKKTYSQQDLSILLGYENGQFISNIERGLCGLPMKKIPLLCSLIGIDVGLVREALILDFTEEINTEVKSIEEAR